MSPTARSRFDGTDIAALSGAAPQARTTERPGGLPGPVQLVQPDLQGGPRLQPDRASAYFPGLERPKWKSKVDASLEAVSLDPGQVLNKYPHQLSGGQLQRLLIARALLLEIKFLVADEIISMLDASTRIDVLNLLGELKARGLGILFITHDLSLGNYISDTTVILRRGASSRWARRRRCSATRSTRTPGCCSHPSHSCTAGGRRPRRRSLAAPAPQRVAGRRRLRARGGRGRATWSPRSRFEAPVP